MKSETKTKRITLAYGNGGQLMQGLINGLILKNFGNPILEKLDDSAVFSLNGRLAKLAFTTDSFTVTPIFFNGGDIGKLAVCGTVNDLCMVGARPLFLSVGFIIEEGLEIDVLEKIIVSMGKTAAAAGIKIVCGDTKVVNKGNCDKIFINTSGIGLINRALNISSSGAKPNDLIIVSGTIAEHGIAILSQREGLEFKTRLKSDCAPLNELAAAITRAFAADIHVMRDPTRGGVASVLNEIAVNSHVGIEIDDAQIPLSAAVKGACEIMGFDPLYQASEGRMVVFAAEKSADQILKAMKKHKLGKKSAIIGKVVAGHKNEVYLKTVAGGLRILDLPLQEQTPRIC